MFKLLVILFTMSKLMFGHLNINKFDLLSKQVMGSINILMVSETKLDDSFHEGQFLIEGFHAPNDDRNEESCYTVGKISSLNYLVVTFPLRKAFL